MTKPILSSPQELETWLDEFVTEQMDELQIPGVTFSLVQNGELFFAKGYGYADIDRQTPVIANRTLFRIGGITKLFTATAIMQLVERELIALDDDVNNYLPEHLQIENYPQPLTIANLLTHTAGFNSRYIGAFVKEPSDVIPLPEYLKTRMPTRIQPPGEAIAFSNETYALLGYVVESVANIPFSQYITENILQPLEMNQSSFAPSSDLALSYQYKEQQQTYRSFPYNHHQVTYTDALNATATDIANFAIAHLQQGRFKSRRILNETTAQQMQQQQFSNDPRLPGMCWGFWEYLHPSYGQRAIGHDGGVLSGYRSLFYLLPEYNLGFFVANNGCANLSGKLIAQFCARYLPAVEDFPNERSSLAEEKSLKRYQGSYRHDNYPRRTLDKINLLWSPPIRLQTTADGTLTAPFRSVYLQEREPSVLQIQGNPNNYVVARENNDNQITALLTLGSTLKKLAWYETNSFHWMLFWYFVLVFSSGFAVSILALTRFPGDSWHQWAQLLAGLTCGLNLVCALGMLVISRLTKNNERLKLVYGVPKAIAFLLFILLVTSVFAVGLPVLAVVAWLNSEWSFIEQLHYSLVALTALGLIPFLNYWNLLGFRY